MLFGTPFAFCFFSTLHGQSSIKAHSGPMNLRLRMHLPLVVPSKNAHSDLSAVQRNNRSGGDCGSSRRPKTGIQVADQVREWHEGSAIVLDDSYVHEVWNDTDQSRVLLLLDLWHPDVRVEERDKITNMFEYARGKGWIGGSNKRQ
jgi:aspartate beta-hydroxylase